MEIKKTKFKDLLIIKSQNHKDKRGFFKEVFKEKILNKNDFITSPHPYPHWTLKEIYEQPQTILNALNHGGRIRDGVIRLGGIEPFRYYLDDVDNIIFLGCGTSYHAGMIGRYLFFVLGI